jgi:hypothetical protein
LAYNYSKFAVILVIEITNKNKGKFRKERRWKAMENTSIPIPAEKAVVKGGNILKTVKAAVERKRFSEINYDDHCEWHDSGTGDCEDC